LEFRVLGPVRVRTDESQDAVTGCKQRTMLACLLLAGGRAVCDGELREALWGERPPRTAEAQIHTYASRIRRTTGAAAPVERVRLGYRIPLDDARFDYRDFCRLVDEGTCTLESGDYLRASRLLHRSLALWRGEAVEGTTDFFIGAERLRLEERRLCALEARIEADLVLGRHRDLVPELLHLVRRHCLRECFRAQLMTALYRCERQADAIACFAECRRLLDDELGVRPGRLVMRTYQSLLSGEALTKSPLQLTT
jgi:DNA-binding SARP family transcriptional activator